MPQAIHIGACRFEIISLECRLDLPNELRNLWRILGRVTHNRGGCWLGRLAVGAKHLETEKQHKHRNSNTAADQSGEALCIQLV